MKYHYAIIDEDGIIVGISHLSGDVSSPELIPIDVDFDPTNKKWNGESWESYTPPEPLEPEPTQLDRMEAQLMKSQDEIRQEGADSVMEELVKRGLMV